MNHGTLKLLGFAAVFLMLGCFAALFFYDDGHGGHSWQEPKRLHWQFDGMQGTFDRQSAQRGLQVYREVCASCHSLNRVAFRTLTDIGFSEAEVKALAREYSFTKINDEGDEVDRPGEPSDKFPDTYPNEQAARFANNGAMPPDLSLMVKARMDGANYVYSLLTGYSDAPGDMEMGEGMHYNPYFPGQQIAMAPPLLEGAVDYEDGTPATVDQMSRDIVHFLQWTAEPEMEERKRMGLKVLLFLAVMSSLLWIAKKRVWRSAK